eukprot:1145133-Pelagomonas_calceolata.AAC.1
MHACGHTYVHADKPFPCKNRFLDKTNHRHTLVKACAWSKNVSHSASESRSQASTHQDRKLSRHTHQTHQSTRSQRLALYAAAKLARTHTEKLRTACMAAWYALCVCSSLASPGAYSMPQHRHLVRWKDFCREKCDTCGAGDPH